MCALYKNLKIVIVLLICLGDFAYTDLKQQKPPFIIQKEAVEGLIERLLGKQRSVLFNITIDRSLFDQENDAFSLRKNGGTSVDIVGNSGVAAAFGFHYYLKYYCNCQVSWDKDQLNLPNVLPDVNVRINSLDRFRYYQNVCTPGYSFVWWDWSRWEREIDWIAMNGINLALAFTAQEAIWLQIYQTLNMTEDEINEHFAGPAFTPWQRMGNLRGWGGPLSYQWHDDSVFLQRKIVDRMKQFGIDPVLPAFCGHVPRAFKRLYPRVSMKLIPTWANFSDKYCCPYLLDPAEDLFRSIGEMFLRELTTMFGVTHYYNCDTFNELQNPFEGSRQLKEFSSAVVNSILKVDPNATYILQGWLFGNHQDYWTVERARNYLSGVPDNRILILDLQSEIIPQYVRLEFYFGKPFIWCMLHNFGGTLGLHGSVDVLNKNVTLARNAVNSSMVGTGLTPEGINQNYVMYDFMLETSWRNGPVNLETWAEKYSHRRYGTDNGNLKGSWKLLINGVYNLKIPLQLHGNYTICSRPSLKQSTVYWYNVTDVAKVWDLFLNASSNEPVNGNYEHDLVDISRQFFQLLFDQLYRNLVQDYSKGDIELFKNTSTLLLQMLNDFEVLLSTNSDFMLGPWLESAKSVATSEQEKKLFEMNAKNQITIWGPNGEILDYATKQWSGMVSDYYYPRWELFCSYLLKSLVTKTRFSQKTFNANVFRLVEQPFYKTSKLYPVHPLNNSLLMVKVLYNKWRHKFLQ